MFYSLTRLDHLTILTIVHYFSNVYPNIPYIDVYNRVFNGYCWGEGGSRILSIEEWNEVFNYTKRGRMFYTLFKDWEEYYQYHGDFHLKDTRFKKKI